MLKEKRINFSKKEARNIPDDIWIYENASSLFKFASIKFQIYGKGAVFINRRSILQPPRYISSEEIKKENSRRLKKFVDGYNPNDGFIISFDLGNNKRNVYRVDVFDNKL